MNTEIMLRELGDEDVALFSRWLYAPHVARWYEQPEAWMDEVNNRHGKYDWIHQRIAMHGGKAIGFGQYYAYICSGEDWHGKAEVDGTYSIDYMIGEADYLRRGLGKQIVMGLVREVERIEGARRIIVQPEPENRASCQSLVSSGFVFDEVNEIYRYEIR